jgi:Tol biopolymer transport system component
MDELRVDEEIGKLLDEAQIPMTPQWEARVLAGAKALSLGSALRRRLVVAIAGVVGLALLALLGLHTTTGCHRAVSPQPRMTAVQPQTDRKASRVPPIPTAEQGLGMERQTTRRPVATASHRGAAVKAAESPESGSAVRPTVDTSTWGSRSLVAVIATVQPASDGAGLPLRVGDRLPAGAAVRTGRGGRVTLVARHGSEFTLAGGGELTLAANRRSAELCKGRLYCRNRNHEFAAITTVAGTIGLLGTVVDASVQDDGTVAVTVVQGRVRLANAYGQVVVASGRRAILAAAEAPGEGEAVNVTAETAWYDSRDRIASSSGQLAYAVHRQKDGLIAELWTMDENGGHRQLIKSYLGGMYRVGLWLQGQQKILVTGVSEPLVNAPDYERHRAQTHRGEDVLDIPGGMSGWWIVDVATGQDAPVEIPSQLTSGALSPDATKLVSSGKPVDKGRRCEPGLWLYDLATGETRKLAENDIGGQPAWSPDGKTVAVALPGDNAGGSAAGLALVDIESGAITRLGLDGDYPVFSPDGKRLAYFAGFLGEPAITGGRVGSASVVDLTSGGPPRRIGPTVGQGPEDERAWDLSWSPDGASLLYSVVHLRTDESQQHLISLELYVAAADGSGVRRIYTADNSGGGEMAWASDGLSVYLADASGLPGSPGLVKIKADGSGAYETLGATAAGSPLTAGEQQQFEPASALVQEVVFQYAVGRMLDYQGQPARARAAYRRAADLVSSLPWRYPLLRFSVSDAMAYADHFAEMIARSDREIAATNCRLHLEQLAEQLYRYREEHQGACPSDLAALGPWAAAHDANLSPSFAMSSLAAAGARERCPLGDAYVYTPPAPGAQPAAGDVLLSCPDHPEFRVVWERVWPDRSDSELRPRLVAGTGRRGG